MMTQQTLVPIEQKQVLFYEDRITAVRVHVNSGEQIYVPLRPICDHLGITYTSQRDRIRRDAVLKDYLHTILIYRSEAQGSSQEMVCLALKYIPGWLFGISVQRVKAELREKIIRYQRECHDVLWEAFEEGRLTADSSFDALLAQSQSEAVEAYKMLQAMVKLARNQIVIEARLEAHDGRLNNYEERLEQIEATLGNKEHHISAEQASRLSQAVKAVALELSKQTRRNEYGGIYGELYRRYEIPSYRELPAHKYEDAMAWLNDWLQQLVGTTPF